MRGHIRAAIKRQVSQKGSTEVTRTSLGFYASHKGGQPPLLRDFKAKGKRIRFGGGRTGASGGKFWEDCWMNIDNAAVLSHFSGKACEISM